MTRLSCPFVVASLLVAAWPASAGAQRGPTPTEEAPAETRRLVLMVPDLDGVDADERLLAAVRAHTAGSDAELDVVRYDPAHFPSGDLVAASQRRAAEFAASAVMWIDLSDPATLRIFVFEVDTAQLLGRRVSVGADAPAAVVETFANIVASVVAESLAGAVAGLERVDPVTLVAVEPEPEPEPVPEPEPEPEPEPAPAPEPAPEPPPTLEPAPVVWPRLWLGLAYAGSTFASAAPWQHGAALSVAWGPAPGAFVGVRYDLVLPSEVTAADIVFDLHRHPVAVEGGYRLAFGARRRGDVEFSARVVVDPIVRRSDARASGPPVTGRAVRVFSAVAPGIGVGWAPIRQVRLGLRVGVEILASRSRYEIEGTPRVVALDPHPARFFAEGGVSFGAIWRPRKRRARGQRK